jgi:pimeloyl-ACP methyl ester carboxylesterase
MVAPTPDTLAREPRHSVTTREGVRLFYRDDFLGEPWLRDSAEVVVLLHGIAESASVWYGWIAALAGRRRVISIDLAGHGRSAIAADVPHDWSPERLASDVRQIVDALGIRRFHLVGAKYGASIAVLYAARNPEQVISLSAVSGPVQVAGSAGAATVRESLQRVRTAGLRTWVEESMDSRLGSEVSAGQRAWWIDLMASTDERAVQACLDVFASLDLRHCLPSIVAPTLFVTANRNALMAMEGFKTWAAAVSQARLVVLDADCYHPAAVKPQECIAAVLPHMDAAGRQEE